MVDPATNEPIRVSAQNEELPYLIVSVQQLDRVTKLLDENHVKYWVGHNQVSVNNGPYMVWVNLRTGTDHRRVQAVLDAAA
jgi:hypothetical protein